MTRYAHPEVLVTTDWVQQHVSDGAVVLVEVDVDTSAYDEGHIAGAVGWNWQTQLCDTVRRDIVTKDDLEALLGASGITPQNTIVLYGDHNNWFAAWAFWQLKMYGHADVRIMDGGRYKWLEENRPVTTQRPSPKPATYAAQTCDESIRAYRSTVEDAVKRGAGAALVDVRSPDEFTGKVLAPPGMTETCQRGGHIPGAQSIPWAQVCNDDGTFKGTDTLREIYEAHGITADKEVITYCRIGERSSHSWFVLKYLLGYPKVRNYDGSWTEWGNLVGQAIETGA